MSIDLDGLATGPTTDERPTRMRVGVPTMIRPDLLVLGALVGVFLTLVLVANPRRIGDGGEYMAMAMNIADLEGPSLTQGQIASMGQRLDQLGGGYEHLSLSQPALVARDGRQEFAHFWLYSALAAPGVRLAELLGVHPNYGFVLVNLSLLTLAAWLLIRRCGAAAAAFVVLSPIVWWVDKAHSEVFTFSLIAIAMSVFERRPGLALICLGIASTQNPPIAVTIPVGAFVAITLRKSAWRRPSFWAATLAAGGIALLHPAYYETTLGVVTPQLLNGGTAFGVPSLRQFLAPLTDLNLGLIWNFPGFLPMLAVMTLSLGGFRLRRMGGAILLAVPIGLIFLFAFAQTSNVNSGGTPGPSRYMLWLIPLMVPMLAVLHKESARFRRRLTPIAMASIALSCVFYVPAIPEWYLSPSPVAQLVWEHFPWLDDPLPEVFLERTTHVDGAVTQPTSFPGCSKVLIVGGKWPSDCPPSGFLPLECTGAGTVCYANRADAARFEFGRP